MLNSLNIFPNDQVAKRMFDIVDFNNLDQIEFTEFMNYIFLLLDGTKEEKAMYIFKMIAQKKTDEFDLQDLIEFYKMIDYRDDQNSSIQSLIEERMEDDYGDMSKAVFSVMHKKSTECVKFNEFKTKLIEQPEMLDLFNFLNIDLDLSTRSLRVKKTYLDMMNILKRLQQDISLLKNILFDTPIDGHHGSYSIGKVDKFNQTIMSLAKQKIKKFPTYDGRSNIITTMFANNTEKYNEHDNNNLNIQLEKIHSNNISIKSDSDASLIKNAKAQLARTGPPALNVEHCKLKGVMSSLSVKSQSVINILEAEIEATRNKKKLNYELKR